MDSSRITGLNKELDQILKHLKIIFIATIDCVDQSIAGMEKRLAKLEGDSHDNT